MIRTLHYGLGKCSFCTHSNYYHKWTGRTAKELFDEVSQIAMTTNKKCFMFTGSSFEDPGEKGKQRIHDFCEMILKAGLKLSFRCYIRADSFKDNHKDRELIRLMVQAGFETILIGMESGNDEDLRLFNKRANVEDNITALRLFREAGMSRVNFGFIMFNPYSTIERLEENYNFLAKNKAYDFMYISKVSIHKGTKLFEKAMSDYLINPINFFTQDLFVFDGGYNYKYVDNRVEKIDQFVTQNLHNSILVDHYNTVERTDYFINSLNKFLKNGFQFKEKLDEIIDNLAEIYKEYFYHLFVERDEQYCLDNIEDFIQKILSEEKELKLLRSKMERQLVREGVIYF